MRDMHNNITVVNAITPQAVGTSGIANGKVSGILDRRGFDTVEFTYKSGTSASAADTITPVIYEAAATGDSFTSVANADLLGTESAITLSAAAVKKVGYIGNKRYLKIRLYGTGTATAIVSADMLLGKPNRVPTT